MFYGKIGKINTSAFNKYHITYERLCFHIDDGVTNLKHYLKGHAETSCVVKMEF